MRCWRCGYSEGAHNPACPEVKKGNRALEELFNLGWEAGRVRGPIMDTHPTYKLGYHKGVIAQEEAVNGFDPVHHQD